MSDRLQARVRRVRSAWSRIEDAEPDISTERLLAMVANDTGEDYGDVTALYAGEDPSRAKPAETEGASVPQTRQRHPSDRATPDFLCDEEAET